MSAGLLFTGIFFGIAGLLVGVVLTDAFSTHSTFSSKASMIIGICLTVVFIALSFNYENFKHFTAALKYDEVVVLDYVIENGAGKSIDWEHVIYQKDYEAITWAGEKSCIKSHRMVIVAKNKNDRYDDLVKKDRSK